MSNADFHEVTNQHRVLHICKLVVNSSIAGCGHDIYVPGIALFHTCTHTLETTSNNCSTNRSAVAIMAGKVAALFRGENGINLKIIKSIMYTVFLL